MTVKQFLFAAVTVAALGQKAWAFQPVPAFEDRRFAFGAHNEYFHSEANLSSSGGSYSGLPTGHSFETFTSRLSGDYKLQKNWRIGGGGEVVYAKSSTPIADRDTTELNSVFIESMYVKTWGRWLLAPQVRYLHSLREVDLLADDVIAGEGTNQFELGSWFAARFGAFEPYAYVAYRSQNDGRANLLPFQVGLRYYYDQIYVIAEVYGHSPLSDDRYTHNPMARLTEISLRNAGSLRFYAINQTLIEGRGELGYRITPDLTLYAGAAHTIDGKSAAYGYTGSFGLLYTFGATPLTYGGYEDPDQSEVDFTEDEVAREYRKKSGKRRPKKKEQFEPLRDDYDESLFTPTN